VSKYGSAITLSLRERPCADAIVKANITARAGKPVPACQIGGYRLVASRGNETNETDFLSVAICLFWGKLLLLLALRAGQWGGTRQMAVKMSRNF
jgi:hypothetical protein